jgi:uncharacterized membrane protein YbhN (UPF0104 family)
MLLQKQLSLIVRIALGVGFGVALLWWLLRDIDAQELVRHLLDFSWERLVPILGLVLLSGVVRAYRWRLLFHDRAPSVSRLFLVEHTGIGVNSLAPVRVLAEPIQFGYLAIRDGYERGSVLASLVLGRVVDTFVTLGTIAVGAVFFPPSAPLRQFAWGALVLGIAVAIAVSLFSLSMHRWRWLHRWHWLTTYGHAWRRLTARPRRMALIVAVTSLQWACVGLAAWLIARDVGIGLPFPAVYIVALGVMTLGFTLPGLPSGLGPFEFSATVLLALYGVSREMALAFGIIFHAVVLLPPVAIALLTLTVYGPPWATLRRQQAQKKPPAVREARQPVASRSGSAEEGRR